MNDAKTREFALGGLELLEAVAKRDEVGNERTVAKMAVGRNATLTPQVEITAQGSELFRWIEAGRSYRLVLEVEPTAHAEAR